MQKVIKKNNVNELLSKTYSTLLFANSNLKEQLKGRDLNRIHLAIVQTKSSIDSAVDVTSITNKIPENIPTIQAAEKLIAESKKLCGEASLGLRLFFELIPGGKSKNSTGGI